MKKFVIASIVMLASGVSYSSDSASKQALMNKLAEEQLKFSGFCRMAHTADHHRKRSTGERARKLSDATESKTDGSKSPDRSKSPEKKEQSVQSKSPERSRSPQQQRQYHDAMLKEIASKPDGWLSWLAGKTVKQVFVKS